MSKHRTHMKPMKDCKDIVATNNVCSAITETVFGQKKIHRQKLKMMCVASLV